MRGAPDYELKQRTENLHNLFDRRGDIAYWDDYESATPKYQTIIFGAGNVTRNSDVAKYGNSSIRIDTGAAAGQGAGISYKTTDYVIEKAGAAVSITSEDAFWDLYIVLRHHAPPLYHQALLRIDNAGITDILVGTPPVWVPLAPQPEYFPWLRNWATVKIVTNLHTLEYERAIIFGSEYDLRGHSLSTGPTIEADNLETRIYVLSSINNITHLYIDDYALTRNE